MKLTPLRLVAALTLGIASLGYADDISASYQARLQPLLKTYCVKCHGTEKQKAKINLEGTRTLGQLAGDDEVWFRVLDQLQSGEMPPDDEKQPSKDERAAMVAWIRGDYTGMLLAKQRAEGRSKLRRLSRTEYANTMEDIFGIRPRVGRNLPPDGRVDGYDKVAMALPLSSEGSIGYLTMAEDVLGWMFKSAPKRKIAAAPAGNPFRADKTADDLLKPDATAKPPTDENSEASRTTRTPAFRSEQSAGHILELHDACCGCRLNCCRASLKCGRGVRRSRRRHWRCSGSRTTRAPSARWIMMMTTTTTRAVPAAALLVRTVVNRSKSISCSVTKMRMTMILGNLFFRYDSSSTST